MRYLPIYCSLALPLLVGAVPFYNPPGRIAQTDSSMNPFDRRMNNADSDPQYTCPCPALGFGRRSAGSDDTADSAVEHQPKMHTDIKRTNPQGGADAPPAVQQPAAPPAPANTCLCAPAVQQHPPVAQTPAVPNSPVSYVTVHSTIVTYTTITEQPPVKQPLQTVYMTHKLTTIVNDAHPTDKVKPNETPVDSSLASTETSTGEGATPTSNDESTPLPTSSVKIILKVDPFIDVYSEKIGGVKPMLVVAQDVQFPPLSKENKEISFRYMWIDDPNATNPLGIANDCILALKGTEDQKTTVTFDIKAGPTATQDREGVSLSCKKVPEKLASIKDGL